MKKWVGLGFLLILAMSISQINSLQAEVLTFSTYLGGSEDEVANDIALVSSRPESYFVTGSTSSLDFPTVNAHWSFMTGSGSDAFVSWITYSDTVGPSLVFSTYLGGEQLEVGQKITANQYYFAVVGVTQSGNFPTLNPLAGGEALSGGEDAFVSCFDASGALVLSSYLGGLGDDSGYGIDIDDTTSVVLAGGTDSNDFPTLNPLSGFSSHLGSLDDGFISQFKIGSPNLEFSTYLGGTQYDQLNLVTFSEDGSIIFGGYSASTDFPTVNPLPAGFESQGSYDVVFGIVSPAYVLDCSSYLGGTSSDRIMGLAVSAGAGEFDIHLTGYTYSTDFPTVNPLTGSGQHLSGLSDSFVSSIGWISPSTSLDFSSYLGGSNSDFPTALALSSSADLCLVGFSESTDFPLLNPLPGQSSYLGSQDAFLTRIDSGKNLVFSSYLGGSNSDNAFGTAVDDLRWVVAGRTFSPDFPTRNPYQDYAGVGDVFITLISLITLSPTPTMSPTPSAIPTASATPSPSPSPTPQVITPSPSPTPSVSCSYLVEGVVRDRDTLAPISLAQVWLEFTGGGITPPVFSDPSGNYSIFTSIPHPSGPVLAWASHTNYLAGNNPTVWACYTEIYNHDIELALIPTPTVSPSPSSTPTPSYSSWYLAAGGTLINSYEMTETISLLNPTDFGTTVEFIALDEVGFITQTSVAVSHQSRYTLELSDLVVGTRGENNPAVSVIVRDHNDDIIFVDRSLYWDAGGLDQGAGHNSIGSHNLSDTWALPEGATHSFDEYIHVLNPGGSFGELTAITRVTFVNEGGSSWEVNRDMPPLTNWTIYVNNVVGSQPHVSTLVEVLNGIPVAAERTMYWDGTGYQGAEVEWIGGHCSIGISRSALTWYIPEGATHSFDDYVLVTNPSPIQDADLRIRMLGLDGLLKEYYYTVEPRHRYTIYINKEVGWKQPHVSTVIDSLPRPAPAPSPHAATRIMAERVMYWKPFVPDSWGAGHGTIGAIQAAPVWYLAGGASQGFDEYVLLTNPDPDTDSSVKLTFYFESGPPLERFYLVGKQERETIYVNKVVSSPALAVKVEAQPGSPDVISERVMYWHSSSPYVPWVAGHASIAVPQYAY